MKINYSVLVPMAIGFSRSTSLIARGIQVFRNILFDKNAPNHAFIITEDHGQFFATEETSNGLEEKSLEEYTKKSNKIVAIYCFDKFSSFEIREKALQYLAEIRRKAGENSKYDFIGLMTFIPGLKVFFKPDSKRQWCSENCASVLKKFGAHGITKTEIAPDELLEYVKNSSDFFPLTNYYL